MRGAFFPVLLIVVGAGWLLNELNIMPEVSWIVIFGLAISGIAVLAIDGVNKSSIVLGPMLMAGALLTFLRQYYGLGFNLQFPALLMLLGLLLLLRRSDAIPPARAHFHRKARQEPAGDV
ncbi:hypothetical protein [Chitinilyticum litopenaei]|uniref:hypothetical protein n=1 Tax=Chitinilyticum litopenaei TaxID=1121276 RepID=UPI0005B7A036|nr:hypothetical protein [Chitinilyticum litopenaei]